MSDLYFSDAPNDALQDSMSVDYHLTDVDTSNDSDGEVMSVASAGSSFDLIEEQVLRAP